MTASRRQFFRMLAGSPLIALAYPALPPSWQRAVDRELRCANCGTTVAFAQSAGEPQMVGALASHLTGQPVDSVDQAINVWDFERVAQAGNLPEHWAYIHMGVDDYETRRANREGFQRLLLRPRRLGPQLAKLDTSVELFGRRWSTPLFLCPVAALEAYHTEGESGAARAARARGILQMQSHVSSQSYETTPRREASRTGFSCMPTRTGTPTSESSIGSRRQDVRFWCGRLTSLAAAIASSPGARRGPTATTARSVRTATITSQAISGR